MNQNKLIQIVKNINNFKFEYNTENMHNVFEIIDSSLAESDSHFQLLKFMEFFFGKIYKSKYTVQEQKEGKLILYILGVIKKLKIDNSDQQNIKIIQKMLFVVLHMNKMCLKSYFKELKTLLKEFEIDDFYNFIWIYSYTHNHTDQFQIGLLKNMLQGLQLVDEQFHSFLYNKLKTIRYDITINLVQIGNLQKEDNLIFDEYNQINRLLFLYQQKIFQQKQQMQTDIIKQNYVQYFFLKLLIFCIQKVKRNDNIHIDQNLIEDWKQDNLQFETNKNQSSCNEMKYFCQQIKDKNIKNQIELEIVLLYAQIHKFDFLLKFTYQIIIKNFQKDVSKMKDLIEQLLIIFISKKISCNKFEKFLVLFCFPQFFKEQLTLKNWEHYKAYFQEFLFQDIIPIIQILQLNKKQELAKLLLFEAELSKQLPQIDSLYEYKKQSMFIDIKILKNNIGLKEKIKLMNRLNDQVQFQQLKKSEKVIIHLDQLLKQMQITMAEKNKPIERYVSVQKVSNNIKILLNNNFLFLLDVNFSQFLLRVHTYDKLEDFSQENTLMIIDQLFYFSQINRLMDIKDETQTIDKVIIYLIKKQLECNDLLLKSYILQSIKNHKLKYCKDFEIFFQQIQELYEFQNEAKNSKEFTLVLYMYKILQEYSTQKQTDQQYVEKNSQNIRKIISEIKKSLNTSQMNSIISLVEIIKFLIKVVKNQVFALKLLRELMFFIKILIKKLESEDEHTTYYFEQTYFLDSSDQLKSMNIRFLNHCYFYKYRRIQIMQILKNQLKFIIKISFQLQLYNETHYFLQKHAIPFFQRTKFLKSYCYTQYQYFILNLVESPDEIENPLYKIELDIQDKKSFQIHMKYIFQDFVQKYQTINNQICSLHLDLYLIMKYLAMLQQNKVNIGQQFFNSIFIKSIYQRLQQKNAFSLQQKKILVRDFQGCNLISFYISPKFNDKKQMPLLNYSHAKDSLIKFLQYNQAIGQMKMFVLESIECYILNNISRICYKDDSKLQIHLQNFMLIVFYLSFICFDCNFLHQSQKFFNIFCSLYIIFKRIFKRSYFLEDVKLHSCEHCKNSSVSKQDEMQFFLNIFVNNEYLLKYIYKKFWAESQNFLDKNRKTLKRFTIAQIKDLEQINENTLTLRLIQNREIFNQATYGNLKIIDLQNFHVDKKFICMTHFEWVFDISTIFPFFVIGNGFQQYFFSLGNSKIKQIYNKIEDELQDNEDHLKNVSKNQSSKEWWEIRINRDLNVQKLFNDLTQNFDYSILFFGGYKFCEDSQLRLQQMLLQLENIAKKEDYNQSMQKSIFYQNSIILLVNYMNNFYKHELQQSQVQQNSFDEYFLERIQKLIQNKVDFLSIMSYAQQNIMTKILNNYYKNQQNSQDNLVKYVFQQEQLNFKLVVFFLSFRNAQCFQRQKHTFIKVDALFQERSS